VRTDEAVAMDEHALATLDAFGVPSRPGWLPSQMARIGCGDAMSARGGCSVEAEASALRFGERGERGEVERARIGG
jgi:hypothetical protein